MPRMPIIWGVPSVDRSGNEPSVGSLRNPIFACGTSGRNAKQILRRKVKPMRTRTSERGEGGREGEREEKETNSAPGPDDPRELGAHCGSGANKHTTVLLYDRRNVTQG